MFPVFNVKPLTQSVKCAKVESQLRISKIEKRLARYISQAECLKHSNISTTSIEISSGKLYACANSNVICSLTKRQTSLHILPTGCPNKSDRVLN